VFRKQIIIIITIQARCFVSGFPTQVYRSYATCVRRRTTWLALLSADCC